MAMKKKRRGGRISKKRKGKTARKGGKAGKPLLLTVQEFAKIKKPTSQPVVIYFTEKQFERATTGLIQEQIQPKKTARLVFQPVPGTRGYIIVPICPPGYQLVAGYAGQLSCSLSGLPPPREACRFQISSSGRIQCFGTCESGQACGIRIGSSGGFKQLWCACEFQLPPPTTADWVPPPPSPESAG
ncbi:MAG: hypothetical protein HYW28_08585 [Rhodospirillales bacterium]|nr:hypothetical protein [Rhodospirillales bacterium]